MGSLKDITVKRETVQTAGGDFTVGPLSAADVLGIFISHRPTVQTVFDQFREGDSTDDIFVTLAVTFPEITAEIIARGAGEFDEETISIARKLDIGAQLTALEKIGMLTTQSVGGLGNLAILVERLAGTVNATTALRDQLPMSGFETFESSAPSSSTQDTETPGNTPSG